MIRYIRGLKYEGFKLHKQFLFTESPTHYFQPLQHLVARIDRQIREETIKMCWIMKFIFWESNT